MGNIKFLIKLIFIPSKFSIVFINAIFFLGEMELTSAVRSVSSSNKCNGMITAARKNQADALNPHPPHGESFFLSPFLGTIPILRQHIFELF